MLVGPTRKQQLRHHRAGLAPTLLAGMQAAVRGVVRPCPPLGGGEILTFFGAPWIRVGSRQKSPEGKTVFDFLLLAWCQACSW